ncbi:hypothetical protein [Cobetia amphilecti]|uniref:hypothetical protein n=1 Tax=Cobetia amphilecti TaxID=1055104 RepID=UPI003299D0FA
MEEKLMEEKLKRLKEFNSKSKQPSQRKECKWCKEEIQKEASICPSCQQPQKKRCWLSAHPSVTVSAVSIIISLGSFVVAWKASNPPPATPKIGASTRVSGSDEFQLLTYNYGDAPALLSWMRINMSLVSEDGDRRTAYVYYMLEDPVVLPVGSSPKLFTVSYEQFTPSTSSSSSERDIRAQDLSKLAPYSIYPPPANDVECELILMHSSVASPHLTETPISLNYQNCSYAMRWLASTKGVAIGEAVQETSENRSPDSQR